MMRAKARGGLGVGVRHPKAAKVHFRLKCCEGHFNPDNVKEKLVFFESLTRRQPFFLIFANFFGFCDFFT